VQDYIKGSNTNRTNTQPREVRSQHAEAVQEESGDHGGQDDGQGAEQVGSQEPPDLRLPHGVRAAAPARHRVPPRHRHTAAAPQGRILPELRAQAGGQVRILEQGTAFVQINPNPAGAAGAPYRGARGAARQRKAAGPGRRHVRGGAGSGGGGGCGGAAMVCDKCEKKLGTVITPDTWKDGARNTTESGGRKLNENKALTSKKARFDPYGKNKFAVCRICKSSVHQPGSHYCQGCAYKKGICSMCGKKVLDTKNYKQTSV
uniref:Cysteine-rich PDZ-binding protein n=1 Tax=Cyanoderma ruficeps TaxID=181631 RepID=A0A8C3R1B7_9PASS